MRRLKIEIENLKDLQAVYPKAKRYSTKYLSRLMYSIAKKESMNVHFFPLHGRHSVMSLPITTPLSYKIFFIVDCCLNINLDRHRLCPLVIETEGREIIVDLVSIHLYPISEMSKYYKKLWIKIKRRGLGKTKVYSL